MQALKRLFIWLTNREPPFKPSVLYYQEIGLTQMLLEDTFIVWCPWGKYEGHAVDCGYDRSGKLVGIQIWDDVRNRPTR